MIGTASSQFESEEAYEVRHPARDHPKTGCSRELSRGYDTSMEERR
jgi:hypothetical protein